MMMIRVRYRSSEHIAAYAFYYDTHEVNPVTTSAWTVSDINNTDWTVDDINNLQIGIVNLSSP